jgi:hypothetical protein
MRAIQRCDLTLRVVFCTTLSATIPAPGALAQNAPEPTKDALMKHWRDRQERTKSARFEWSEQQTDVKGSLSSEQRVRDPKFSAVVPTRDTTFTGSRSVAFDGARLRYECKSKIWAWSTNAYQPHAYLASFDGLTCAVLRSPTGKQEWHEGQIRPEKQHIDRANLHLQPVLMTFRALMPGMHAYDLELFKPSGVEAIIGKSKCVELVQPISTNLENRLCVDPSREHVVLRIMTLRQRKVVHQADISYKLHKDSHWVPEKWRIVINDASGFLLTSHESVVTSFELNVPFANSTFEMDFPLGTKVIDDKERRDYIVKPDGSGKRLIAASESRLSYAELVDPNEDPGTRQANSGAWWYLVVGAALACGAAAFYYRERRTTLASWRQR